MQRLESAPVRDRLPVGKGGVDVRLSVPWQKWFDNLTADINDLLRRVEALERTPQPITFVMDGVSHAGTMTVTDSGIRIEVAAE